jgi:radical SAM family uncharacterized protein/radical SAM-linked protein
MLDEISLRRVLRNVQKPARYTGGELNTTVKENALIRMAVSYPDLYEVGMSNSGIKILYDIANRIEGVSCERVFSADMDLEKTLTEENIPLFTLETKTPLQELDLLAFNAAHELLYTNILQILHLGKIPLKSESRRNSDPIIICGGSVMSNPAPFGEFCDAVFIGDGEDGIREILEVLLEAKKNNADRDGKINLISKIEGVLIPSRYINNYDDNGLLSIEGEPVSKRRFISDNSADPDKPIVTNIRTAHERGVVEVARGCPNLCKFCHAGYYDLPFRNYKPEKIELKIRNILKNSGYDEITLTSLSISDYKYLPELIEKVLPELTENGISISVPSLRVDLSTLPLIEIISDLSKVSLTFAVESGSEYLRSISCKKVSESDLLEIVNHVLSRGWKSMKFYFMIGLPGCEEVDEAEETILLIKKIISLKRNMDFSVTLSPFVPKPHTPFQWVKMQSAEYFDKIVLSVKRGLPRSVKIKNHDIKSSIVEGIFARGDSRLSEVILKSFQDGCRLDSWGEHFRYNIWKKNLYELAPWHESYLSEKKTDDVLPWKFVKTGYEDLTKNRKDVKLDFGISEETEKDKTEINPDLLKTSLENFKLKYIVSHRVRIKFSKTGNARYIPHLDFAEIVKRGLRMAGAPLAFTQGFNKHVRISFAFPLPLGIESECELCDAEFYSELNFTPEELTARLPDGIKALSVTPITGKDSLMASVNAIGYRIEFPSESLLNICLNSLEAKKDFFKKTKKTQKTVPFDSAVISYSSVENKLNIILSMGTENSVRIDDAISSLAGITGDDLYQFGIIKTAQYSLTDKGLLEF